MSFYPTFTNYKNIIKLEREEKIVIEIFLIKTAHTKPQLPMRSLRPEHFFTSEVVLHTCGPTQTVAKSVLYRWSIK